MIDIHIMVPLDQQKFARAGIAPKEWDVMIVGNDELLGVVETFESGYTFTDSFGKMTEFNDGEGVGDVMRWIHNDINSATIN